MTEPLKRPWLVATWPGMGGVGQIAGFYLARTLGAETVGELNGQPYFVLRSVGVKRGLMQPPVPPRSVFHAWRDPAGERDLLILIGEGQPEGNLAPYADALLDDAAKLGVERVVTFGAMATPVHPKAKPRTFAAATSDAILAEFVAAGAEALEEGEVGGMNGAFAAAAAARGIPAACLLGEFPFFAASFPNPKGSVAVLETFVKARGLKLDLRELRAEGKKVEAALERHLAELQDAAKRAAEQNGAEDVEGADVDGIDEITPAPEAAAEAAAATPVEPPPIRTAPKPQLSKETEARVEALFAQAAADRSKAMDLKAELDRLGAFKRYEDRFLDLFKAAG